MNDYTVWLDGDVALIVPITTKRQFIFVRQYKHGAGDFTIEFPAGYVDRNEPPIEAAKRELEEETGYHASTLRRIGQLVHNPTKAIGTIHIYVTDQLLDTPSPTRFDETEQIEVLRLSVADVCDLIDRGEISSSGTIAAFHLATAKLGLLQASR